MAGHKAPLGIRYNQIPLIIAHIGPQTIIETGTWRGRRGLIMMGAALQKAPTVHYTGYDLFEHATPQTDSEELNVKVHKSLQKVTNSIAKRIKANWENKATFNLIAGNTRETLKPNTKADFAFIDGGHSIKTISHDYHSLSESSVIIIDDYYIPNRAGSIADTTKYGCNQLIQQIRSNPELTITTLPQIDRIKGGGNVQLILISRIGHIWPIL